MSNHFPILIVDDDPLLTEILSQSSLLGFPEASFLQVHSTAEAITYIKSLDGYGPKLVLLDCYLQDRENGLDFLAFLRGNKETRYLPVVILTVSQIQADIDNAYSLGASSFTVKPSCFDDWVSYLRSLRHYWFKTVTLPRIRFQKMV